LENHHSARVQVSQDGTFEEEGEEKNQDTEEGTKEMIYKTCYNSHTLYEGGNRDNAIMISGTATAMLYILGGTGIVDIRMWKSNTTPESTVIFRETWSRGVKIEKHDDQRTT
jgi:hypothetical protein